MIMRERISLKGRVSIEIESMMIRPTHREKMKLKIEVEIKS
jgi:hypothetical protein